MSRTFKRSKIFNADSKKILFLINNFELFANKVKITNGAAEEGSPGIERINPNKFF